MEDSILTITKTTTELSPNEKKEIINLFNRIFKKERDIYEFDRQCINNCLGYSYHILIYDKNELIAHAAYVPSYYYIDNLKILLVDGIDGMIDEHYRDSSVLLDLFYYNRKNLINNKIQLEVGFPNTYAMKVYQKGKLYTKVGEMSTYILPYKIGGIKHRLCILNFVSVTFCRIWVFLSSFFASNKDYGFRIFKDNETFNETRYKRMDGNYSVIKMDGFVFAYKIMLYDNIRTAFLIDVTVKNSRNFNTAVRYILKHESKNFDLLLYVGNLVYKGSGLIKIPKKIEPKQFNFAIKILDNSLPKDVLLSMQNWDVNLSNYDLL